MSYTAERQMTKNDLIALLNDALLPEGFKRKGNYWVDNRGELSKIVNLQKSEFGDSFYVNYGFVIKRLPSDGTKWHIYLRVHSDNSRELLKLGKNFTDEVRSSELSELLDQKLVPALQAVNTEEDIRQRIVDGTWHYNTIPISVKKYFNLE
jgi:hypothetical protein